MATPLWKYGACCQSPRNGVDRYIFVALRRARFDEVPKAVPEELPTQERSTAHSAPAVTLRELSANVDEREGALANQVLMIAETRGD